MTTTTEQREDTRVAIARRVLAESRAAGDPGTGAAALRDALTHWAQLEGAVADLLRMLDEPTRQPTGHPGTPPPLPPEAQQQLMETDPMPPMAALDLDAVLDEDEQDTDDDSDECTACGTVTDELYRDPGPYGPLAQPPDAQFCRSCASDKFTMPAEPAAAERYDPIESLPESHPWAERASTVDDDGAIWAAGELFSAEEARQAAHVLLRLAVESEAQHLAALR